MTVELKIALPEDVYRVLVAQATRCETQVHKLITAATVRSVRGEDRHATQKAMSRQRGERARVLRAERERRVKELHAAGKNDTEVAEVLGIHQTTASSIRRGLHLEAHTHRRRRAS